MFCRSGKKQRQFHLYQMLQHILRAHVYVSIIAEGISKRFASWNFCQCIVALTNFDQSVKGISGPASVGTNFWISKCAQDSMAHLWSFQSLASLNKVQNLLVGYIGGLDRIEWPFSPFGPPTHRYQSRLTNLDWSWESKKRGFEVAEDGMYLKNNIPGFSLASCFASLFDLFKDCSCPQLSFWPPSCFSAVAGSASAVARGAVCMYHSTSALRMRTRQLKACKSHPFAWLLYVYGFLEDVNWNQGSSLERAQVGSYQTGHKAVQQSLTLHWLKLNNATLSSI